MSITDIENIGFEPVDIGDGFKACKFKSSASYKLINPNAGTMLLSWLELNDFIRFLNEPTEFEKYYKGLLKEITQL